MEPLIDIPESVLVELLVSHARLGKAEYERNPQYNSDHYQHKASTSINAVLKEHHPRTFARFMTALDAY